MARDFRPPAARRSPRAPASPDAARLLAWQVLRAVDESDAYANLVLPDLLRESRLDQRDRALVAELAYGTLRATGTLDHVIGLCSSRPVAEIDPALRDALRLGAYQLLRTRIPVHAAVGATVELARRVAGEGPGSFANAVLRKIANRDGDLGAPSFDADPVGHLSITTAHPRWVVEAFVDALDGDLVEAGAALRADDERPEVHLVARPGRITRDALLQTVREAGLSAEPGPWSPYAVRLGGGDPGSLAPVRDGRAAVQDEGSQLAAMLVAALTPVMSSGVATVLDVCAGPGGKAALVGSILAARGGASRVLGTELHPHRARLTAGAMSSAVRRDSDMSWAVVATDATRSPWRDASVDVALLDAPCTGLGALRRRPEARWRRQPADVPRLAELQRQLVDAALRAVRVGGHLVYVVCSPHVAEGRSQVEAMLAAHRGEIELVDIRPHLRTITTSGTAPWVQLWPHRDGTDAMFLAVVRRVATLG